MDKFVEEVYLNEIGTQCGFALNAAQAANEHYRLWDNSRPIAPDDVLPEDRSLWRQEIFRNLHSFLTHTANVSKLLWPQQREGKPRAKYLKTVLKIDGRNALRDRTLRDHLDHYDERLDNWAVKVSQKDVKSIATDGIGPVKIKLVSGPFVSKNIEEDRMRWLDDTTGRIHFRGEAFDIQPVIEAMENLSGNIKTRQTVLRNSSSRSETEL